MQSQESPPNTCTTYIMCNKNASSSITSIIILHKRFHKCENGENGEILGVL